MPIKISDNLPAAKILEDVYKRQGFGFQMLGFSESNIITVYILSVLITSVITSRRIYSLASSLVGVLIFNFFFTAPHYSLMAYDSGYPATFVIMFLSAFISSSLAVRIQKNARQSAVAAYRTKILLDTNQMLQKAGGKADIVQVTAGQLMKLLHRDIVFYLAERDRLGEPDVCLLYTSRLEDGRLVLQKQPEAVEEIIANALEHIAKRAPEREIGVDIPEDLLLVPCLLYTSRCRISSPPPPASRYYSL